MPKSKVVLATAIAAVLLGGGAWFLVSRQEAASSVTEAVVASDSGESRRLPEVRDVPSDLVRWIDATLWRNGLLDMRDSFLAEDPSLRTRLAHDSADGRNVWKVDFSGLPVSVLGRPGGAAGPARDEEWTEFDIAVRVHRARFCHEDDPGLAGIPGWLEAKVSGLDEQTCTPADDVGLVQRWFRATFGELPEPGEVSGPVGKSPTAIRVRCLAADTLRSIGLLRSLGLDTLEFDGCRFDEGSQMLLAQMDLRQLVLKNVAAPALDFSSGRIPDEMRVEGGEVNVVMLPFDCPDGKTYCEDEERMVKGGRLVLRDVPVCDTGFAASLARRGVVLENPRCADYPVELIEARDRMRAGWQEIFADPQAVAARRYDSLEPSEVRLSTGDALRTWAYSTTDWDYCEDDGPYPDGFSTDTWEVGKDWINDERVGHFARGEAIALTFRGKTVRAGLTKAQVIAILGRPTVNRGSYLAWGVHNQDCIDDLDGIVARFDSQGRLESLLEHIEMECGGC